MSNKKILSFRMIFEKNRNKFESEINDYIAEGWELHGNIVHNMYEIIDEEGETGYHHNYLQGMVRYRELEKSFDSAPCEHEFTSGHEAYIPLGRIAPHNFKCWKCGYSPFVSSEKTECEHHFSYIGTGIFELLGIPHSHRIDRCDKCTFTSLTPIDDSGNSVKIPLS